VEPNFFIIISEDVLIIQKGWEVPVLPVASQLILVNFRTILISLYVFACNILFPILKVVHILFSRIMAQVVGKWMSLNFRLVVILYEALVVFKVLDHKQVRLTDR
jgi:hypothetical protein